MLEDLHLAIRINQPSETLWRIRILYAKRTKKNTQTFDVSQNGTRLCPQYLTDLLPALVSHITPYHRRRPLERAVSTYKTELFRNSFVPSTTSEWNSLPGDVQQTTSLSVFKRALCTTDSKVPAYYYIGERSAQIIHCRLRLQLS